ncbi:MAG: hypothetical protein M3Q71_16675 [Chloroflexota bacterium]|nr:hypothetical protein [Chloroflexota bacterium]
MALSVVALLVLLALILARHLVPRSAIPAGPEGEVVARIRVGRRERLHLHVGPLAVGAALLLADVALSGPRPISFALYLLGALLLVAVPLHYTVTDQGLRLGHAGFRRWTEFAGVSASRGQIRLQPVDGGRRVTLWLSSAAAADLEPVLRHRIWASYRGVQPRPETVRPVSTAASYESQLARPPCVADRQPGPGRSDLRRTDRPDAHNDAVPEPAERLDHPRQAANPLNTLEHRLG